MNRFVAQKMISIIWFSFSGLIGAILFIMTIRDKFGEHTDDVWKWYSILIIPSLTLILTTFLVSLRNPVNQAPTVDKFFFYLSFFLSLFYLLSLLIIVLYTPFAESSVALFNNSVTYLALFQGLVTSSLGLFFTRAA